MSSSKKQCFLNFETWDQTSLNMSSVLSNLLRRMCKSKQGGATVISHKNTRAIDWRLSIQKEYKEHTTFSF